MTTLNLYNINYKGLKPGKHNFDYVVDSSFFSEFEESEIKNCNIKVDLELEMKNSFFILNFDFKGTVVVECDRCLDDINLDVDYSEKVYVYLKEDDGVSDMEEDADIVFFPPSEDIFNVSQLIYEFVHLNLPFQRLHGEDEDGNSLCDESVTKYLGDSEEEKIDPRWSQLSNLKGDDIN